MAPAEPVAFHNAHLGEDAAITPSETLLSTFGGGFLRGVLPGDNIDTTAFAFDSLSISIPLLPERYCAPGSCDVAKVLLGILPPMLTPLVMFAWFFEYLCVYT